MRIVHANSVGLKYLDQRNAVRSDGDCFSCRDPTTTMELSEAIQTAFQWLDRRLPALGHCTADHHRRRYRPRRVGLFAIKLLCDSRPRVVEDMQVPLRLFPSGDID